MPVVRHRLMIIGHFVSDGILEPVHHLPLCTRSVERRQDDVTRLFRVEMVGTTENVEVHVVILGVRVDRKMRL